MRAAMRARNGVVVRLLGWLLSDDPAAYAYLPASVDTFASAGELARAMRAAGLRVEESRELSSGIVALTVARREGA